MTNTSGAAGTVADDWDAYWRSGQCAPGAGRGGLHDEALGRFWSQVIDRALARTPGPVQMLDIGCGSGAVARYAAAFGRAHWRGADLRVYGLDYSHAALVDARKRSPQVSCVASDAASVPFGDRTFDLITSQFGIEYAGPEALAEAARVLRPGGLLAAALHVRDGGIYRECQINRQAVDTVRDCNLLGFFRQVVQAFHHAREGVADKAALHAAYTKLADAVAKTEQVLGRWGRAVATGLVFRLCSDVVHMARRIHAYESQQLIAWTDFMADELRNYSQRMTSMLQAALDREMVDRLAARLHRHGLTIRLRELLGIGDRSIPVAWMVAATKAA